MPLAAGTLQQRSSSQGRPSGAASAGLPLDGGESGRNSVPSAIVRVELFFSLLFASTEQVTISRLFTISEYYDRDRPAYYKALQSVRERGMNMTGWLEYFTEGLGAQMRDVQMTAGHVMRKDVIPARARKNGLKDRPVAILGYLLNTGKGQWQNAKRS